MTKSARRSRRSHARVTPLPGHSLVRLYEDRTGDLVEQALMDMRDGRYLAGSTYHRIRALGSGYVDPVTQTNLLEGAHTLDEAPDYAHSFAYQVSCLAGSDRSFVVICEALFQLDAFHTVGLFEMESRREMVIHRDSYHQAVLDWCSIQRPSDLAPRIPAHFSTD